MKKTDTYCDICGKKFGSEEEGTSRSVKINLTESTKELGKVGDRRSLNFDDICLECSKSLFALLENFVIKKRNG